MSGLIPWLGRLYTVKWCPVTVPLTGYAVPIGLTSVQRDRVVVIGRPEKLMLLGTDVFERLCSRVCVTWITALAIELA